MSYEKNALMEKLGAQNKPFFKPSCKHVYFVQLKASFLAGCVGVYVVSDVSADSLRRTLKEWQFFGTPA